MPNARPVDTTALICSPADGKLLHSGIVDKDKIEQIKGVTYSLHHLLQGQAFKHIPNINEIDMVGVGKEVLNIKTLSKELDGVGVKDVVGVEDVTGVEDVVLDVILPATLLQTYKYKDTNDLYFTVIYLAPGDYHRFHSPVNWHIQSVKKFSGELYSVSPIIVGWLKSVFALNERVVVSGTWEHGYFGMIAVGN